MAQKSKTQRAKASAARAARKEARELESQKEAEAIAPEDSSKKTKISFFKKSEESKSTQAPSTDVKKQKNEVKKERFKFLKEVRFEMKRVTWPTRPEVIRWSVVVVAALIFFGVYVALLDNAIVTPILLLISSLGA